MDPTIMSRQAALVAASDAVASRFALGTTGMHRRGPAPAGIAERFRPVPLHQVPSLLPPPRGGETEDATRRLARYTTAASLYTLERKEDGFARQLLSDAGELDVLRRVAARDKNKNRSCAYCRLLNGLLYHTANGRNQDGPPPVEPLNHEARITPTFNPDTNVSSVTLTKQQWLVRGASRAKQMVMILYPLLWHETNPDLFRSSDPAEPRKSSGLGPPWQNVRPAGEDIVPVFQRWNSQRAAHPKSPGYIWEVVAWPWNETMNAEVQNIIRIDNLKLNANRQLLELDFDYALEECMESNFGVAFERSGLDVDGGDVELCAKPAYPVRDEDVAGLTARDLAHLGLGYDGDDAAESGLYAAPEALVEPTADEDKEKLAARAKKAVQARIDYLSKAWKDEVWLVTSTLTKRFRFTAPQNGPIELWAALNYSAPALLVMFMNRAASLPAHLVASGDISPKIVEIAELV